MKNILCILCIFLCCISCAKSTKRKIGMEPSGPNEGAVIHYPKLSIPSEFNLPDVPKNKDTKLQK